MSSFYTNVQSVAGHILYRGVLDGKRVKQKIEYSPSLYISTNKKSEYRSLDGEPLMRKIFGNIYEAKDYLDKFKDVSNSRIFGNTRYEYAYIAEHHPDMVDWDQDKILVAVVDIEVGSENGFPDPYDANEPITAIAITYMGSPPIVLGCGDYEVQGDETYIKCRDEWTLRSEERRVGKECE
jgi:hypothetical protein